MLCYIEYFFSKEQKEPLTKFAENFCIQQFDKKIDDPRILAHFKPMETLRDSIDLVFNIETYLYRGGSINLIFRPSDKKKSKIVSSKVQPKITAKSKNEFNQLDLFDLCDKENFILNGLYKESNVRVTDIFESHNCFPKLKNLFADKIPFSSSRKLHTEGLKNLVNLKKINKNVRFDIFKEENFDLTWIFTELVEKKSNYDVNENRTIKMIESFPKVFRWNCLFDNIFIKLNNYFSAEKFQNDTENNGRNSKTIIQNKLLIVVSIRFLLALAFNLGHLKFRNMNNFRNPLECDDKIMNKLSKNLGREKHNYDSIIEQNNIFESARVIKNQKMSFSDHPNNILDTLEKSKFLEGSRRFNRCRSMLKNKLIFEGLAEKYEFILKNLKFFKMNFSFGKSPNIISIMVVLAFL